MLQAGAVSENFNTGARWRITPYDVSERICNAAASSLEAPYPRRVRGCAWRSTSSPTGTRDGRITAPAGARAVQQHCRRRPGIRSGSHTRVLTTAWACRGHCLHRCPLPIVRPAPSRRPASGPDCHNNCGGVDDAWADGCELLGTEASVQHAGSVTLRGRICAPHQLGQLTASVGSSRSGNNCVCHATGRSRSS